jgi:Zn-dependent protease with chaperone function
MKQGQFETLVSRMEGLAAANPAAYRRRVLAWAALGYGFLLLVAAGLLGLCVLLLFGIAVLKVVAVKLLLVVGSLLWVLLRSLWIRFEPPEGERVTRGDSPALFALLDELRADLKTPVVHEVVLTPQFNAAVTQLPRLRFLGWHRNYLLLGLPLMKGLTVEQFKSVLAHELGHLSRGHARVGNWIYRLRLIWARLDAAFAAQGQLGATFIRTFFHWYVPRFNAISFPFARTNEYEADAASVRVTSVLSASQALTSVHVMCSYFEEKYWPAIHAAAKDTAQPAFSPYSGFAATAIEAVPEEERVQWQQRALAARTSYADTHPSLTDRLAAIGAQALFVPPRAGEGAEQLLGTALPGLQQRFDMQWREQIANSWRAFHEQTQKSRARLAELREQAKTSTPDGVAILELAELEEHFGEGAAIALGMRRDLVAQIPDFQPAQFALGRQLVLAGSAEGVLLLEAVIAKDVRDVAEGAGLLRDFFWKLGDKEAAAKWHERSTQAAAMLDAARRERNRVSTTDPFAPHGLSTDQLANLVEQLRAMPAVRRVYLVRKLTVHYRDVPLFVLGFTCSGPFSLSDKAKIQATQRSILGGVAFPGETFVFCVENGANKGFVKRLKQIRGSRIL